MAAQIETRWLWNFVFSIEAEETEVRRDDLYEGKVIIVHITSCSKVLRQTYFNVKCARNEPRLTIICRCIYSCPKKKKHPTLSGIPILSSV